MQIAKTAARKGCKMSPLLKIPFQFVVVDTLDMFLCIMGRLFHQVHVCVGSKVCCLIQDKIKNFSSIFGFGQCNIIV